jgi:hypothetical protein
VYAKTVEVFLDVAEFAVPSEVADQLARSLGVDVYEVESAVPLATQTARGVAPARRRLRPAAITQVRVHPDGCTLSVQARHRPYETIERVEVGQTDDAVVITVLVGSPDDDDTRSVRVVRRRVQLGGRHSRPSGRRPSDHSRRSRLAPVTTSAGT